jgi:hypothetical protein
LNLDRNVVLRRAFAGTFADCSNAVDVECWLAASQLQDNAWKAQPLTGVDDLVHRAASECG